MQKVLLPPGMAEKPNTNEQEKPTTNHEAGPGKLLPPGMQREAPATHQGVEVEPLLPTGLNF